MATFNDLHRQNHEITEISNVFLYLIRDRSMCDTQIACDLFFTYAEKVKAHIELVDRKLCGKLIAHADQGVNNIADRFMSGSQEIKKLFSTYLKDWCSEKKRELKIKDHKAFVADTEDMFGFVLDRIQRETEHLYPLIRRIEGNSKQAA